MKVLKLCLTCKHHGPPISDAKRSDTIPICNECVKSDGFPKWECAECYQEYYEDVV